MIVSGGAIPIRFRSPLQITGIPDGPSLPEAVLSLAVTLLLVVVLCYVAWRLWRRLASAVRYDEADRE